MSLFGISELTAAVDLLSRQSRNSSTLLAAEIASLRVSIRALEDAITRSGGPPSPLGGFTFRFKSEVMSTVPIEGGTSVPSNLYDVDLPTLPDPAEVPAAKDVVRGEILLMLNGVEQPVIETDKEASVYPDLKIKQGVVVVASFQWRDDAGNVSLNALTLPEFVVRDTVPPPDPVGGFGFRAKGEVEDDPAPEPVE